MNARVISYSMLWRSFGRKQAVLYPKRTMAYRATYSNTSP